MRGVSLLVDLTSVKLINCASVDDYVNKLMTLANKLKGTETDIPDHMLAAIMLAGLPDKFRPFVMTFESSTTKITTDLVKNKILQEIKWSSGNKNHFPASYDEISGFYSTHQYTSRLSSSQNINPRGHRGRGRGRGNQTRNRCYQCNKFGNFGRDCPEGTGSGARANAADANYRYEDEEAEDIVCCGFTTLVADSGLSGPAESDWILDSGASCHMSNDQNKMCKIQKAEIRRVTVANSEKLPVELKGEIILPIDTSEGSKKVRLSNVLYVPNLSSNLVSVGTITDQGYDILFKQNECLVFDKNNKTVLKGVKTEKKVYKINA